MAEKPVIVPVSLEVTDVDLSKVDPKKVQSDISTKLTGLKKAVEDVLGSIDTSKVNKAITDSVSKIEKSMSRLQSAQDKFNAAMVQAGKSSEAYKADVTALEDKLKGYKSLLEELSKMGPAAQPARDDVSSKIAALEKQKASINPANYIDTATTESLQKVEAAYRKVATAIADVNKQATTFNTTVDNNKLTDEYSQAQARAEALKAKLEELNEKSKKMASVSGTTDSAWENLQYDVKTTASELESCLRSMSKMVNEGNALRFDAAKEDVKELKSEIRSIRQTKNNIAGWGQKAGTVADRAQPRMNPYTADYQKELNQLSKLEEKASELTEKYKQMKAAGDAKPEAFQKAKADADALQGKIDATKDKLTSMVNEGKAFRFGANGDASAELNRINTRVTDTTNSLSQVKSKGTSVMNTILQSGAKVIQVAGKIGSALARGFKAGYNAIKKVASGLKRVVSGLASVASKAKNAISNMTKFGRTGNSTTSNLSKGFKKLKKNILMFGLGFRSTYYLIKKIRTYFVTAFKTLATQSDEVNKQVSSLTMSFTRLKASLATAFQPLMNVVTPILNTFMNQLSNTLELLGKFFATLTGQKYIYKATANQYDYAQSLKDTADAAEETTEKLAAYDKLDVIKDDSSSSSSSSDNGLYDVTYTKADAEGAVSDFAKMVKEAWEKADFTQVGQVIHDKIVGILDNVKKNIVPKVSGFINRLASSITTFLDGLNLKDIGKKVAEVFNTLLQSLNAKKIGEALGAIKSAFWQFASGLINDIDWELVGTKIAGFIVGFLDKLDVNAIISTITGLVNGIGKAIGTLVTGINWADIGTRFGKSFMKIFTDIDFSTLGANIAKLLNGLVTTLVNFIKEIDWKQVATALANGINSFLHNIDGETFKTGLTSLVKGLVSFLVTLITKIDWSAVWEAFKEGIDAVLQGIQEGLQESDSPVLQTLGNIVADLREAIKTLWPVVEKLVAALSPIVEAILPVFEDLLPPIAEIIAQIADMVLPVIISLVQTLAPIIKKLAQTILPVLQKILTALQPVFKVLTDTILPIIAKLLDAIMPLVESLLNLVGAILTPIAKLLEPLLELVGAILEPLIEILSPIIEVLSVIIDLISALLEPILDLLSPLINMLKNILSPLFGVLSTIGTVLQEVLVPIIEVVSGILETVLSPILEALGGVVEWLGGLFEIFGETVGTIFDGIKQIFSGIINFIKGVFTGDWTKAWEGIKQIFSGVWTAMKGLVEGILKGISAAFEGAWKFIKGVWDGVVGFFSNIWKGIQNAFAHVADWFKNIFSKAWEAVKKVFETGGKVFEGIKDGIVKAFKIVVNAIIRGINKVIAIPFDAINGILDGIRGIDLWGWKPFDWIGELPVPKIPELAQGAVIPPNSEFLAILGDQKNGTNVEAPLDTIKQAVAEVLAQMGGGNHEPIILQIDGKVIARVVWDENEKRYKQTGKVNAYA